MKILCKLFGHKWVYSFLDYNPFKHLRTCKWCHQTQEWKRNYIGTEFIWSYIMQFADKGAKEICPGYGK